MQNIKGILKLFSKIRSRNQNVTDGRTTWKQYTPHKHSLRGYYKSFRCSHAFMGSQPSIPQAISVLLRTCNFWMDFAASLMHLSCLSWAVRVMVCHNSAPYSTVGIFTLYIHLLYNRRNGCCIDVTWISFYSKDTSICALIAHELLKVWCISTPTWVADCLFNGSLPNFMGIFIDMFRPEKTTTLHLSKLYKSCHLLE